MSRAIIVGGGVAGCVAALGLAKAGWEPEIFESHERSAGLQEGVFLTLAVNGLDALAAVGAADAVGALGFATGSIRFTSGSGRDLGAMAIGPRLADGTVTRTLRRAELYAALSDLCLARGIPFRSRRRLVGSSEFAGGVRAEFADGTAATGDVLIGADGVHSVTRRIIDPLAPSPRYTGMGNAAGFARLDGVAPDGGDYRMIWGRRCFFGYTVSPDGAVWWFANPPAKRPATADELRNLGSDEIRTRLVELLKVDRTPAADIVRATEGRILFGNQYDMPRVPTWQRGRRVVIGDAAHAVSPSTGQGASLAIEDAVVLAQCLRDVTGVPAALARYEALRRRRVERVAAWGAGMGGSKTPGPLGRVIRDLALPRVLAKGSTPEAMQRQAWLFSHHLDWDGSVAVP